MIFSAESGASARPSLLLATLLSFSSASAQSGDASLETLVVSGTRIPEVISRFRPATVLEREEIELRKDGDVLDLLAAAPGVHVNLPGSRGNIGEVFLRGGEPNFTTLLVDGVQVNDPTNTRGGSFDFATLHVDDIERVEILRGPYSAIYGSDALSGAINVLTRAPADRFGASFRGELGGQRRRSGSLQLGGPVGGSGHVGLGLTTLTDGGTGATDRFESDSLTLRANLSPTEATTIAITGRAAEADSFGFPDSSGGPRLASIRKLEQRQVDERSFGIAVRTRLSSSTGLHAAASRFEHSEATRSPGVAPSFGTGIPPSERDSEFSRNALQVYLRTSLPAELESAAGIGIKREEGDSAGSISFGPSFSVAANYALLRETRSVFAELASAESTGLGFVAGIRIDDHDTAARVTSKNLTIHYVLPAPETRFRAAWGEAFKMPSFFSLADPIVGNPALRPEIVRSAELGVEQRVANERASWQVTLFRQRFRDLVDFDFETFRTVNRSRVKSDGIEAMATYVLSEAVELSAHATYSDIEVVGSRAVLRQRPDFRAGVSAHWRIGDAVSLHADWLYIGERFDSAIPTGERALPSYVRADIALNWVTHGNLELGLAIDNIADARYEEAIGFPAVGRRVRLSVNLELGP
ncbi:MAG TPA: TonB-dependent receptor [Gammaproteobacteria bacterium]